MPSQAGGTGSGTCAPLFSVVAAIGGYYEWSLTASCGMSAAPDPDVGYGDGPDPMLRVVPLPLIVPHVAGWKLEDQVHGVAC